MTPTTIRTHWFFAMAPAIVAANVYVAWASRGSINALVEAALLFDLAILLPSLYWLCYRQRGRTAVVRAAAVACLGIWMALRLVPESQQHLLAYMAPLRYLGLAALAWLEIVVIVAIYKSIFQGGSVNDAVQNVPAGIPPWAARLLALEARFFLRVWSAVKRALRRK